LIKEQCALSFFNPLDRATHLRLRKLRAIVTRYRETRYWRPVSETNRVVSIRNWDFRLGCVKSLELEPVNNLFSFGRLSSFNPVRHIQMESAPLNAAQLRFGRWAWKASTVDSPGFLARWSCQADNDGPTGPATVDLRQSL